MHHQVHHMVFAVKENQYPNRNIMSNYFPLVIDDYFIMCDRSGGNCYMSNHTLSQKYFDSNNGDVSSGYGFDTSTLSPNVNIEVTWRRWLGMLKMFMLMWAVNMVFKISTLSPNVKIQLPFRRLIRMLKRVVVM